MTLLKQVDVTKPICSFSLHLFISFSSFSYLLCFFFSLSSLLPIFLLLPSSLLLSSFFLLLFLIPSPRLCTFKALFRKKKTLHKCFTRLQGPCAFSDRVLTHTPPCICNTLQHTNIPLRYEMQIDENKHVGTKKINRTNLLRNFTGNNDFSSERFGNSIMIYGILRKS